jgi:hypothetical protein
MDFWLYFQEYGGQDTLNLYVLGLNVRYCQGIARLGERECVISITGPQIFPKMEISQPLRLIIP